MEIEDHQVAKCICNSCGIKLEFPVELAGTTIACPQCSEQTPLILASDFEDKSITENPAISADSILASFNGDLRRHGASFFYQAGLLLVTIAIVILPLLYIALVGLSGYGVYWWARKGTMLFGGNGYGVRLSILKVIVYLAPLLAGVIVVFFMIKPLLARRTRGAQPLALNPGTEPLLFVFITQICKAVGAPFPTRIDVDCRLNASASFRRGLRSIGGNDLVLTLGLPLVAGMTVSQLAGVIAHEFGHFTQGFAMRLTLIIGKVNRWFAVVVYERDDWDFKLEEAAANSGDWRIGLLIGTARLGVWLSRLFLKILMYIGAAISSFVSRQMEYNADRYYIELVGSRCFGESMIRIASLATVMERTYEHMDEAWKANKTLPENIPGFMMMHDALLPVGLQQKIANEVGLERAGIFSSHPASGDRIKQARIASQPGIFTMDRPARELFANFEVLSKQVTFVHYQDEVCLPRDLIRTEPTHRFFKAKEEPPPIPQTPDPATQEFERILGQPKLKLQKPE